MKMTTSQLYMLVESMVEKKLKSMKKAQLSESLHARKFRRALPMISESLDDAIDGAQLEMLVSRLFRKCADVNTSVELIKTGKLAGMYEVTITSEPSDMDIDSALAQDPDAFYWTFELTVGPDGRCAYADFWQNGMHETVTDAIDAPVEKVLRTIKRDYC